MEHVVRKSVWSGLTQAELSEIDTDIQNVVAFPPEDPEGYSGYYLALSEKWKANGAEPVSVVEIHEFYNNALQCLEKLAAADPELDADEAKAGFKRMWPQLKEQLAERPYYEWVKKYAMKSAFIYTYFVDLSGRSPALEMAKGSSWDLTGKYRKIPPCDAAHYFRVGEPTFRSFVQRDWFSQQKMLAKAIEIGWQPGVTYDEHSRPRRVKAAFLGGGLVPQLRFYDLNIETVSEMFDITVYDRDPQVPELLEEILGKPIEDFGIKFCSADFSEAFKDEANQGAYDIVLSTGMVSYYAEPEKLSFLLDGVHKMLKDDGVFVCDRQVFEISMKRCVFVLRWRGTGMKPDASAEDAITAMIDVTNDLFSDLVYEVDYYNDQPAIVNFAMQKKPV